GGTADRNRSHWSTSKTPSYTKSVSWQHHQTLLAGQAIVAGKIEQDNIIDVIYSFHSLSQHNQEAGKLFHQHIDSVKLGDDLSLLQLLI
ncbi:hypothetical protein POV13_22920, partial [Enterobacter roggenkampii]